MNIIELEEGLRNLIATQPAIMSGANANVIASIKNIIESHKTFAYELEKYPEQDILKVGLMNESSKLELNLTSYVCQILQERGINIMLYVPKYAAVYNQTISKYVDELKADKPDIIQPQTEQKDEKYIAIEKNEENLLNEEEKIPQTEAILNKSQQEEPKKEFAITSKTEGRDYLMNLLKK